MAFYWANIGITKQEVFDGKFLWAPTHTTTSSGNIQTFTHWTNLGSVKIGDIVFCNYKRKIIYVAIAKNNSYQAIRPKTREFHAWKKNGNRVDIDLNVITEPLDINFFAKEFKSRFNVMSEPKIFSDNDSVFQGYLAKLQEVSGVFILDLLGDLSIDICEKSIQNKTGSRKKLKKTTRKAIIEARVGQGQFRQEVLTLWNKTCPVTGLNIDELLIASHIFPWSLSDNKQKIDKYNGIPLAPNIDKLFDKGYISFSNDGEIICKESLSNKNMESLNINPRVRIFNLRTKNKKYLRMHRKLYKFE